MKWSEQEERVFKEIEEWESQLYQYEPTDFEMIYDKWLERSFQKLNPSIREKFFRNLDGFLFHMHAFIQGSQSQIDARQRIITEARVFNENIRYLEDLRDLPIGQLIYIADQHIAKHRFISFTQGGISGTGGLLLLGVDIPAMAIINLRAVQLIALTYGYDVNIPSEMMTSLRVFHIATLPKRLQASGWESLKDDVKSHLHRYEYLYDRDDELTNESWMEQPIKQIMKTLLIVTFRKKLIQGIPLIGMAIGAGMNYQLSRQVTDFAHRFYQYRILLEKQKV